MASESRGDVWQVAYKLASSGQYADSLEVERELRSLGFQDVNRISDSQFGREQITDMCRKAREANGG